jgi:hypothetical protein
VHPFADDFFRLAHDDGTGRPRLNRVATGLGLAAALLGELTWLGKITVQDGSLYLIDSSPPDDALAHALLAQVLAEPQHREVRIWLEFFSREAQDQVARRLWQAGHVRKEVSRRLLRQSVTWVPTDVNVAYHPWWRLTTHLHGQKPMDHGDAFLAGLAAVTGLDRELLLDAPPSARRALESLVTAVWPPLRELLMHTEAAVGDAVLHYRA